MRLQHCAVLLMWAPLVAHADALEWLQRMNDAVRQSTYEGIAVYRSATQLETLQIAHRNTDGAEYERMLSLSGPPREVLREGERVICVLPDQKAILTDHQGLPGLLPKLSRAAFEQLSAHYDLIQVAQQNRVAGRACQEIQVRAKDAYRYHYEVCLDEQSALPLDVRLRNENNELLEQVMFAQINFPAELADSAFAPSVDVSDFRRIGNEAAPASAAGPDNILWEVVDVPAGFRLATRERQVWPGFDSPVTQLLYSDGLASVSLFATSQQLPEQALQGLTRMGGVNAYGRMMGTFHITVVGEVPQATVRYFGDNLRQVPISDQP